MPWSSRHHPRYSGIAQHIKKQKKWNLLYELANIQHNTGSLQQVIANINLNEEKFKVVTLKSGTR